MRIASAQSKDGLFLVAVSVAVVSGCMVAFQSRINGALADEIGSFAAAGASFATGLMLLTLFFTTPSFRRHLKAVPVAVRAGGLRWWQLLGGVGGGCLVSTQTYAVPLVGVAAFLIAVVGGQGASALWVDRQGWGPAPPMSLSWMRVSGALLAVSGVAVAATASGPLPGGALPLLPLFLAFAVGLGGSVQYALNGRVTVVTKDPIATAWVNFTVGSCTVLVVGAMAALLGPVAVPTSWDAPWWAWLGGPCGVLFIAGAAWAVQHTGVLVFGLLAVTSQLGVGLTLDLTNPVASGRIGAQFVLGLALTVAGAATAGVAARLRASRVAALTSRAD